MELKDQVVSLKLAKKLKELGFEESSLWTYVLCRITNEYKLVIIGNKGFTDYVCGGFNNKEYGEMFSAYTAAELGEILPQTLSIKRSFYLKKFKRIAKEGGKDLFYINPSVNHSGLKTIDYITYDNNSGTLLNGYPMINENTEADSRAKMLIYLKENNLI